MCVRLKRAGRLQSPAAGAGCSCHRPAAPLAAPASALVVVAGAAGPPVVGPALACQWLANGLAPPPRRPAAAVVVVITANLIVFVCAVNPVGSPT